MKKQLIANGAAALMLAASLGIAGCGSPSNQQGQGQDQKQEQSATKTDDKTSGDSTEAKKSEKQEELAGQTVKVSLTNDTGYDVTTIAVRAAGESEYDATHTFEGITFKDGMTSEISFQEILKGGKPVETYDVLLTTAEESFIEVFDVDLVGAKDLTIKYENGVGYVEYRTEGSDEVQSNQEEAEENSVQNTEDIETYDTQNQLG